jgi:hypothetical protein
LSDKIWDVAEERKKKNVEERLKIMSNGLVEFNMGRVTNMAQKMM